MEGEGQGDSWLSLAEAEDSPEKSRGESTAERTSDSPGRPPTAPTTRELTTEPELRRCSNLQEEEVPASVPVKKWYQISFNPAAFCKRVFQTMSLEPSARTGSSAKKMCISTGVRNETKKTSVIAETERETLPPTGPPSRQEPIVELQIQKGEKATFRSHSAGHPAAVSWDKDGELPSAKELVEMGDHGSCCSLTLIKTGTVDISICTSMSRNSDQEVSRAADRGSVEMERETRVQRGSKAKLLSLYELHEEIGSGLFGVVRRAVHRESGQNLAAKFLPLKGGAETRAYRERDLLARLDHPAVACLRDSFCTSKTLVLLTDLCSSQGLLEHLLSKGSFTESELKIYIRQVLEGIGHIHSRNILHLDIKPANILMSLSERENVKICDFGFAQEIDPLRDQYSEFGTPEFVAPEIVCQWPVTKATDIWSLGVLIYLCLTGRCPFSGDSDRSTLLSVRDGMVTWDDPNVTSRSQQSQDFLRRVLQNESKLRLTSIECLEHEWFQIQDRDEESINSKNFESFVSRSKWQHSLTCYGSILSLRPIAELLEASPQDTSLADPQDTSLADPQDTSLADPQDTSLADPQDTSLADPQDQNTHSSPSPGSPSHANCAEMGNSAVLTASYQQGNVETGPGTMITELSGTRATTTGSEMKGAEESTRRLLSPDQSALNSYFQPTAVEQESAEEADICSWSPELSDQLTQRGRAQPMSSDEESTGKRIPRESIVKSTFHNISEELSPLSARRAMQRQKKFTKRHKRSRIHLGSSLSGRLDEPLIEDVEDSLEGDRGQDASSSPSALSKSCSLDSGAQISYRGVRKKRRSRSLDEHTKGVPHFDDGKKKRSGSLDESTENTLSVSQLRELREHMEEARAVCSELALRDDNQCISDISSEILAEPVMGEAMKQSLEFVLGFKDAFHEKELGFSTKRTVDEAANTEILLYENFLDSSSSRPFSEGECCPISGDRGREDTQRISSIQPVMKEPLLLKPLFLESNMPVSIGLTSQHGLEPFERSKSMDLSVIALGTLEVENQDHFQSIHKAISDCRIHEEKELSLIASESVEMTHSGCAFDELCGLRSNTHCSQTETEEVVTATEGYSNRVDISQGLFSKEYQNYEPSDFLPSSQYSPVVPKMVITVSEDSHISDRSFEEVDSRAVSLEEVYYVLHQGIPMCPEDNYEYLEETMSDSSPGRISLHVSREETELNPQLKNLLAEAEMHCNCQLSDSETTVEDSDFPANSGFLRVPCECHMNTEGELGGHISPVAEAKPHTGKFGKAGLMRFFRRQSWTGHSLTPAEKVMKRQASDGDSTDSHHQQHERTLDLSITKKVKASVSNISKAVLGRQPRKEDKKEGTFEATTAGIGSAKRTAGLFSMKMPGFKRNKEPVFLQQLTDQAVYLGQEVTMRCRLICHPAPGIQWYKEARRLKTNNQIRLAVTDRELLSLTIYSAKEEDLGSYRCVASNALGQASTSCTLIVSELPTCPDTLETYQLYGDGLLLVWRPVESIAELTYCIQYSGDGVSWTLLEEGLVDSYCTIRNLAKEASYTFRVACFNRAGVGPFSKPSAPTVCGFQQAESYVPLIYMETPWFGGCGLTGQDVFPFPASDRTYSFLSEINRGRLSVVTRCQEHPSGLLFAAKITAFAPERRQWALREYQLLSRLRHASLVGLHAGLVWPNHLVLIQDLCAGQELLYHLAARDLYGEMHVQELLRQVFSATLYLHHHGVLHLDLKSENLLVLEGSGLLKVVDLGSAQTFTSGQPVCGQHLQELSGSKAPEILEGQGAGPETDIWAIGVLGFIMLSADDPFRSDIHLEKDHSSGGLSARRVKINFGRCYSSLSEGALNFLKKTLNTKPRARPTAGECLQLPWIQGACQFSKQRDTVMCFPTDKLRTYLQEQEPGRERIKTKLQVPLLQ